MSKKDGVIVQFKKPLRLLDLEFQIAAEREAQARNVKGEEFDTVTTELMSRIETLESEFKDLLKEFENLRIWLRRKGHSRVNPGQWKLRVAWTC